MNFNHIAKAALRPSAQALVAFVVSCTAFPIQAQISGAADAATQELQLQQERERALRKQREQTPDVRLPRPLVPAAAERFAEGESPCFPISRIVLSGDSAERFQFALRSVTQGDDPAVGRCLGTRGINLVLARVQNSLIAKGFVTTRVLTPPQDLKSGELVLALVPGRIRDIRFAPGASERGTYWNALPASRGDILNLRDIEQGLENFKRVPTAEASVQIEPAQAVDALPGESDLVIAYQQAFPFRLTLSADNGGLKSTGKYQGAVTFSYDNWWTLNDLFYASFSHDLGGGDPGARGSRGNTLHYSIPFGYWTVGATSNAYDYRQAVAGANQTIIFSGRSKNSDIKVSRLVYRDAVRKTTLSVRGFLRTFNNFIDDTEVEVQRRRTAGWEAAVNHREFIGSATFDANLGYRRGSGAFGALPAPEEAFGEGTSRFKIITADLNLSAPFSLQAPWGKQTMRYSGTWRTQVNQTPLTPQDRFSIGNRYTVRGFDGERTLLAERGWLVRNDFGVPLGGGRQEPYVGVDYGEVAGPSSDRLLGRRLAGAVFGLRGNEKGVAFDLFLGWPLSKPEGFVTASPTAGFNLSWSY